eukprot:COSAG01_NODE_47061_length_394_cov_0.701695_1_plen_57_part_10
MHHQGLPLCPDMIQRLALPGPEAMFAMHATQAQYPHKPQCGRIPKCVAVGMAAVAGM